MFASIPFIILDSLVYASWLFLVASGLTLIYGVMKVLNIAHGSLYAFGAYANAWLIGWFVKNFSGLDYLTFLFIPACLYAYKFANKSIEYELPKNTQSLKLYLLNSILIGPP